MLRNFFVRKHMFLHFSMKGRSTLFLKHTKGKLSEVSIQNILIVSFHSRRCVLSICKLAVIDLSSCVTAKYFNFATCSLRLPFE